MGPLPAQSSILSGVSALTHQPLSRDSGCPRLGPPAVRSRKMAHHSQTLDLIKDLVLRLTSNHPPDAPHSDKALKYAVRILTSRLTPSISPDEAAVVESIKRRLVTDGRSSDALTFADLCSKFSARSGAGCVANRWAVLYLLKVIAEDRRQADGKAFSFASAALSGGLPALSDRNVSSDDSGRKQNGGVFVISKDPEGVREIALQEYADLVRSESDVSEGALVRDVLYVCQGIDGKYVKYDKALESYALPDSIRVSRPSRIMVKQLCELGRLFRKVKGYINESMGRFTAEEVGTVGQAFSAALQDELSDYYKLLAVLESQSLHSIPLAGQGNAGNYISLRRLAVWFAEPMVRMHLMAGLVDGCKVLRGGAMAGAIHGHAQHGDPMVQDFMRRLLRRVCSPLFEMVRSWVLEGELEDIFGEFFIVGQPVKAESLWREGYQLHDGMLPAFISPSLAQRILRTGKSINFLRVCCDDQGWADAASEAASAAGTTTMRGGLGYGETDALETLVIEAAKRIDKHLMEVIYKCYKFKEHCLAIKRYLLLGQGDFVQYLMDIVGPELSEPANTISSFKLAGLLESAIRSSNAQYDDPDILERLRVKMMPHDAGDRGWDVFSLEYNARVPLDTVFTESVMAKYLRIFNFLWKLRRVEHALTGAWKTMKPNCISSDLFAEQGSGAMLPLVSVLRSCQVLWNEMNHFVTNLQYYIMFEVLEESWSYFLNEMEVAKDLDDLLRAHEKYLNSILEKSLLGERSQNICKALFVLFDLVLRFRSYADRLYEGITELRSSLRKSATKGRRKSKLRPSSEQSKLSSRIGEGRKAVTQFAIEFRRKMGEELDTVSKEYSSSLEGFISLLPVQQHVDLKFLLFRLDFTEFYSQLHSKV
ncbi:Gamma-tubulin complex component 3 [Asimina triloba]